MAMQAWFRGSRGRKKVNRMIEKRRSMMEQVHLDDIGALVSGKREKKKKRKKEKKKREGGMGRKYKLENL